MQDDSISISLKTTTRSKITLCNSVSSMIEYIPIICTRFALCCFLFGFDECYLDSYCSTVFKGTCFYYAASIALFWSIWFMMTSSNGNIFHPTGPLWAESTGHRWIPLTKTSDAEHWCFLWSTPEQTVGQTIETAVFWDAFALIMTSLYWNARINREMFTPVVSHEQNAYFKMAVQI